MVQLLPELWFDKKAARPAMNVSDVSKSRRFAGAPARPRPLSPPPRPAPTHHVVYSRNMTSVAAAAAAAAEADEIRR